MGRRTVFGLLAAHALLLVAAARRCDLGPSDVIFVAHLTHLLSTDHVDDVKRFMRDVVSTYDIGSKSVRVGVLVYDNSADPLYALPLDRATSLSQAESEMMRVMPSPCGFAFCKVDPTKTMINAVQTAQNILSQASSAGRMRKIIVIQTGRVDPGEEEYVQALQNTDPWLRITQVHIGSPEADLSPEQRDYIAAYYQPYERYLGRLRQLYPNMTIPEMQYPRREIPPSKSTQNGVVRLNGFDALCTIRNEICELTFACPPCNALSSLPSSTSIDPRPLMKPAEVPMEKPADPFESLPWPSSLTSPRPSTTTTVKLPFDDAYEYEISADPPGLTVNHTPIPIKDKRGDSVDSASESSVVDFEDLVVDSIPIRPNDSSREGASRRKKKAKRSRSPRAPLLSQSQCTCAVPVAENPTAVLQQSPCAAYQPPHPRYVPYFCGRSANPPPRCAQFLQQQPCGRPCGGAPCARASPPPCGCGASAPCAARQPRPCGAVPPCGAVQTPCGAPAPLAAPLARPPAPEVAEVEVAPEGPTPAYPQSSAVEGSSIESTDILDWAEKFGKQIEENAAKKNEEDNKDDEYEDFVMDPPGKESKTERDGKKKKLTDFDKEYDYEAIPVTSSSKKAADEGWKKLLVDKRKNPRRIDNDKPDPLLVALSILRPTPPSIDRLLNAFGSVERKESNEQMFRKETVAPRTTTAFPIKKRRKSFESQSQLLTVDDVALARTTPPSTAEMLRRLQKLEEVLEAEAVIEAEKESIESLALLEGAARSRRTLKPSTLEVQTVSQKDVEREKVVKELHRLGKAENVNALFQEDARPVKRPSRSSCLFSGIDIVLLIDDLSAVKSVEGLHLLVESIHRETLRTNECQGRSRLAVLSLVTPGMVKMISPLGALSCPQLNTGAGCPLNETRCDQALSEGLILGVNLLTQEANDRRKAIVVMSARNPKASKKFASSLSEALQLAASLGVDVQPVEIGGTDLRSLSTLAASGVAPLQWQDDPSGQLGLRNALCSQLSASEEELNQKQAYCPWKESNSTD